MRRRLRTRAEPPDFTNMVDVLAVVLVVFLLTAAPVYTTGISTERLQAGTGPASRPRTDNIVISFDRVGALYWQGERLPNLNALEPRIAGAHQRHSQFTIAGDREAGYGVSLAIKERLHRAGVRSFNELLRKER